MDQYHIHAGIDNNFIIGLYLQNDESFPIHLQFAYKLASYIPLKVNQLNLLSIQFGSV